MLNKQDIFQMIEDEDIEFIRLQFTDVWGNLKNIAVTPDQMDRVMENKFSVAGEALYDGVIEFNDELYLVPDLDTFVILPWRPQHGKVGKLICDICYEDGSPCDLSPRTVLKKVVEDAKKEGYTFMISPECEFFLFHTDDNGAPTTISHEKAGYLDVGPSDFGENARRDMVLTLEEMGFEIESSHHEKAPGQHEIDFTPRQTLEAADSIVTFKFAVRSIAKRFGLYATFMPKPVSGVAGSGMHLNISMFKDGKNLFDGQDKSSMSEDAKAFIGGILAHGEGLCAVNNPIVNSYKRFAAGFDSPLKIDWSCKGERSFVKCCNRFGQKNVELRFPDSSANPYLAIATCIAAGMDGIKNKMELPVMEDPDGKDLPGNLSEAVEAMLNDKVVCDVLGNELVEAYATTKMGEWKDYMTQVSDWEIGRYLSKM